MTDDRDLHIEQLGGGAVEAFVAVLGAADPAVLSGLDCLAMAERLARAEKACAAARVRFAARAANCGAHGSLGFASGEEWAARLTGSSVGQARDELALAGKLATCPSTSAALAAGELSLAQAVEIARTEKALPGTEDAMVGLAGTLSLGALRDEGRKRRLAALDPGEAYKRQHRERSFRAWTDAAGMTRFQGALTPDKGVPFLSRLGAVCDRLQREARRAGSTESREAHAADALVALLEDDCACAQQAGSAGGVSDEGGQSSAPAKEARTEAAPVPAQADVGSEAEPSARKPKRSPSVELVLLWDVAAARRGHTHHGEMCFDPGRRPDVGRGGARAGQRCLREAGDP